MRSRIIFSMLRVSTSVLFYLLVIFSVIFLVMSIAKMAGKNQAVPKILNDGFEHEVLGFGMKKQELPFTYSQDSLVRYQGIKDHYVVQVNPNSAIGYYGFVMKLIQMGLGIAILWNFKRIFRDTNLADPFRYIIVKRLKMLAALFIISDVLTLTGYFLFNSLLHRSIASPRFELLTSVGNGITTGLIILIIAVVYQRGVSLREENALTV